MDAGACKTKIKALFDKLLHNNFELSDYYSENLLKYLDGNRDKCVTKILETPFFADLLINALKNDEHASLSVKIFITKLTSIVLHNEVHFNRFVRMRGIEILVARAHDTTMPPELLLAAVQQTLGLTAHYFGIRHTIENKLYLKVLDPYSPQVRNKTPAVMAIIYGFMSQLIWKLNEYEEEEALLEVLQYVVDPLMADLEAGSEVVVSEPLLWFLNTLVHVLGRVEHLVVTNHVVSMLSQMFSVEKLSMALETTREPALARLLAELALRYCFATSRQAVLRDPESESRVNLQLHAACNKIVYSLIQKGSYETVLDFLGQCHAFWHKVSLVCSSVPFEKFDKKYLLEHQFLLLLLVPVFMRHKMKRLVDDPTLEEANEIFHSDLAQTVSDDVVKLAYELRNFILAKDDSIVPACACSVRELLRLRGLLSQQQACVMFKTLYYALSKYVLSDGEGALVLLDNPLQTPHDERFLSHVLEAITMLLDEYEINWYESIEVIELQAALVNLIKQNILPIKLLVQAVKLVTLSVRKLLSPELSLLLESRRGGSLREAAAAARALLARRERETQVAALELLLSFTEIAYVKFVALRNVISENGLVIEAAHYALCSAGGDPARAQAVALRCLVAATKCEDLWLELLASIHNLYEQLVGILRNSPDGEVRKEAANVLSHVYINHRVTETFTSCVARAMTRAAMLDPHWPVQIAAINFWKQYIKTQFSDRGMIDGTFPSVTFCKEKRKIIVLNDKEIHKQLEIIMDHLSTSGCLAVLVKCMEPHNNRKVIELTCRLTSKIVKALDYYKYSGTVSVKSSPQSISMDVDSLQSIPQTPESAKIEHSDLISELFDCFTTDCSRNECPSPVDIVHPNSFLVAFREAEKRLNSEKVDLWTLINELVAL